MAICDIDPDAIDRASQIIEAKGQQKPTVYGDHERAYEDMLVKENLDAVVISTNWRWHTPMSLAAMEAGSVPWGRGFRGIFCGRVLGVSAHA